MMDNGLFFEVSSLFCFRSKNSYLVNVSHAYICQNDKKEILRATVLSEHSAQTYKGSGLPFNFIVYYVFCMFKSHWTSTLQSIDPIG